MLTSAVALSTAEVFTVTVAEVLAAAAVIAPEVSAAEVFAPEVSAEESNPVTLKSEELRRTLFRLVRGPGTLETSGL